MDKSSKLFRADGRIDELLVHVRPWSEDIFDEVGFGARSFHAGDFGLELLGPSAVCGLLRLWRVAAVEPGASFGIADLAPSLGVHLGPLAALSRARGRLVAQGASESDRSAVARWHR